MAINAHEIPHSAFNVVARIVTSATICASPLSILSRNHSTLVERNHRESASGPMLTGERHRTTGDRIFGPMTRLGNVRYPPETMEDLSDAEWIERLRERYGDQICFYELQPGGNPRRTADEWKETRSNRCVPAVV